MSLDKDNLHQMILNEKDALRHELRSLKNCQIQYFSISITATGLIIGFGTSLSSDNSTNLLFIGPLLIIIPCWWIFFDKATTITRIVGYFRVLEEIAVGSSRYRYFGWETALSDFRRRQPRIQPSIIQIKRTDEGLRLYSSVKTDRGTLIKYARRALRIVLIYEKNRYWICSWYTFFILSLFCFITFVSVSITDIKSSYGLLFMTVIVGIILLLSVGFTFGHLYNLIFGKYSYRACEVYWRRILRHVRKPRPGRSGGMIW